MSRLDGVRRVLEDAGFALSRAVPRSPDHLLLQVVPSTGVAELAGQWFGEPGRAGKVAAATRAVAPGSCVLQVGNAVLQGGGADRRLPALAAVVGQPGARLVAHRPERRGVVAHRADDAALFTKVVRPGRAAPLADDLRRVAQVLDVPVPEVVDVDAKQGTVTTRALPGRTLHDRLREATDVPGVFAGVGAAVGAAVAALHRAAPPAGTATHGATDELAVVHRWLDHAARWGVSPLPAGLVNGAAARTAVLLARSPARATLVHRDLHDKQLLLGPGGPGVLDLDLLAAGDPALDLANLLVHLELRARQGRLSEVAAMELAGSVVEAYRPSASVRSTAPGYLLATRLRLAAVYAFRPASTAAAASLLTDPLLTELVR